MNRKLLMIILVAFVLRFLLFLMIGSWKEENFSRIVFSDALEYHNIAVNFIQNQVFAESPQHQPDVLRTPGYPAFIMTIYFFLGAKPYIVIFFQIIISALTVFWVYKLAELLFNEKIAILSAAIFAFDYTSIFYCNCLLSETIFLILFVIHIYFLVLFFKTNHQKFLIFSAILLGLSCLCRVAAIYFFVFLVAVFLINFRADIHKGLRRYALFTLCFLLILVPWSLRNYFVADMFAVSMIQKDIVQWNVGRPKSTLSEKIHKKINGCIKFFMIVSSSEVFYAFNVPHHPVDTKQQGSLRKLLAISQGKSMKEWLFIFFIWGILCVLYTMMICGMYTAWKNKQYYEFILLAGIILYFLAAGHAISFVARYRLPIMPFVAIFAAHGILHIYNKKMGFQRH